MWFVGVDAGEEPVEVCAETPECVALATLLVEGTPGSLTAAEQITKGVDRGFYAVGLTPGERTAVLACLEDPLEGLVELRGVC